jgi:hypothetical protein
MYSCHSGKRVNNTAEQRWALRGENQRAEITYRVQVQVPSNYLATVERERTLGVEREGTLRLCVGRSGGETGRFN